MIIDRIEGALAVVEVARGKLEDVPVDEIKGRARDGAVLKRDADGALEVDEDETARRARHAKERLRSLFDGD